MREVKSTSQPRKQTDRPVNEGEANAQSWSDGRAYSRRTVNLFRSLDPDVLLPRAGSALTGMDALLTICERRACDYLDAAGLPHTTAVRYWRDEIATRWRPLYAWPPAAKGKRVEVRSLADLVSAAGHRRDSHPDLACRMLEKCADLRHAMLFKKHDDAVRVAFALGVLWQLVTVYEEIDGSARRGGCTPVATPWPAYAALLQARNQGRTKKEIWRTVPERGMAESVQTDVGLCEIYREGDQLLADGPERSYALSERRFFDVHLRKS